jgi:hypothetical protein
MRMSKLFLALSVVSLGALAQPYPAYIAKAAAPRTRPARLEGMDYVPARRVILSYGWRPAAGPCFGVTESECASFPEIDSCSCCGRAPCAMLFIRANRCLLISTEVGPPETGAEESDTHVVYVAFRRHDCSKNPS